MKEVQVSGNAHYLYPADMLFGLLWLDEDNSMAIPKMMCYSGDWGGILSHKIALDPVENVPVKITLMWISLVESKIYYVESELPHKRISDLLNDKDSQYTHIVVGMGLYGHCSIWIAGLSKSSLVATFDGDVVNKIAFKELNVYNVNMDLDSYCQFMLNQNPDAMNHLQHYGLPKQDLFKHYSTQYNYQYRVVFDRFKDNVWIGLSDKDISPVVDNIRDTCFDGTYSLVRTLHLCHDHKSGIPKRVILEWFIGKRQFNCYFEIFEEQIFRIFSRFYGAHPETKTDFIIRIDAENKKYELALYRQGLKEPVVIPESAYQLIVFKNKFEDYRSENYDQPRGAWIW